MTAKVGTEAEPIIPPDRREMPRSPVNSNVPERLLSEAG